MYFVGRINKEIFRCVTNDIQTDEVIITEERIQHIKERHPNDYERYCSYISSMIAEPDYILEANKPNTAFVLKEFSGEDGHFQLIMRIKTQNDNPLFKNSVITFLKINQRTWDKYLRNKKILYNRT